MVLVRKRFFRVKCESLLKHDRLRRTATMASRSETMPADDRTDPRSLRRRLSRLIISEVSLVQSTISHPHAEHAFFISLLDRSCCVARLRQISSDAQPRTPRKRLRMGPRSRHRSLTRMRTRPRSPSQSLARRSPSRSCSLLSLLKSLLETPGSPLLSPSPSHSAPLLPSRATLRSLRSSASSHTRSCARVRFPSILHSATAQCTRT